MRDNADLAYPLTVTACGHEFFVTRSLDLCRRVERAFGAIEPLVVRLRSVSVPLEQMAVLLDLMLADFGPADNRPSRSDIEAWLFERGVHVPSLELCEAVQSLIVGNEVLARVIERKKQRPQGEGVIAPFAPAAASRGPIGS